MKGIRYILSLLTLCVAVVSCERGDSLSDVVQESGRPIEFSVESDWPEITKALISNSDDIKGVGFKVWGVKSSDSDGSNSESVFGEDGASVSFTDGKWKSDVVKDWEGGYYSFASILHPAKFEGTYSNNTLSIDLGDNGYNLAVNQDDFMVAFQNVDNSGCNASVVDLDFKHLFAKIDVVLKTSNNIPFESQGIAVTKVLMYGIHRSINGNLQIQQNVTYDNEGIKTSEALLTNIANCFNVSSVSTDVTPYYKKEYTAGEGFNYNGLSIIVIDDLLVFPETFSENQVLYIVVELFNQGKSKEISARISSGQWLPGESNTYLLQVDPSIFN